MNNSVNVLAIGDLHFKKNYIHRGKEVFSETLKIIKKKNFDFIVLLGDILHDHEVVDTTTFNLACNFIHKLSEINNVFVIIGNHDYINNSQFLSDNHPFNPLKKWKGVNIIDKPKLVQCKDKQFLMCPYVYPGRFLEAIDSIDDWYLSDCIFCHQEFKGCKMGAFISDKGDVWDTSYPQIVSGHIHDHQIPQDNIFYTGSAIQHGFNESSSKYIFELRFSDEGMETTKLKLNIKNKKIINIDVNDIDSFNENLLDKYEIKMNILGHRSDFHHFRSTTKYKNLRNNGVLFSYKILKDEDDDILPDRGSSIKNFDSILKEVILNEPQSIKDIYENITSTTLPSKLRHLIELPKKYNDLDEKNEETEESEEEFSEEDNVEESEDEEISEESEEEEFSDEESENEESEDEEFSDESDEDNVEDSEDE